MHLFTVITYCLVYSVFGKHTPDTDPGEDFPLDFSAFGEHIPDAGEDFPSFDLDDSAFDIDLNEVLHFDPMILNSTQEIPGVCFVCKKVVRFVFRRIPFRPSKRQVANALHTACRRVRVPHRLCRKIVKIGRLVHKIVSLHGARLVCRALHLCWWPLPENTTLEKPAAKPAPPRTIRNHLL